MAEVVAIFAEGSTEIEFYKAVVINARELMGTPFKCEIEYADIKGIGNYKSNALRKFSSLQKKYQDKKIQVFLCIDHDVFELQKKPPIDKKKVKQAILDAGAQNVTFIEANQSIEDWFLHDLGGVILYLRLSKKTKRPKGNGQAALKALFNQANRVYVKGSKTEGFIEKLNILKIMSYCCKELKPLCNSLGLNCTKICNK